MTQREPEYWCVGLLHDPQPEDKLRYYCDEREAIEAAHKRADCDHRAVVAVWNSRDEAVWIFTDEKQWSAI